jgi:hypothetical protein
MPPEARPASARRCVRISPCAKLHGRLGRIRQPDAPSGKRRIWCSALEAARLKVVNYARERTLSHCYWGGEHDECTRAAERINWDVPTGKSRRLRRVAALIGHGFLLTTGFIAALAPMPAQAEEGGGELPKEMASLQQKWPP